MVPETIWMCIVNLHGNQPSILNIFHFVDSVPEGGLNFLHTAKLALWVTTINKKRTEITLSLPARYQPVTALTIVFFSLSCGNHHVQRVSEVPEPGKRTPVHTSKTSTCGYYRHEINFYVFKYVKTAKPLGSTNKPDLENWPSVQVCAITDPFGHPKLFRGT